jgi:hypothetical protein
VTPSSGKEVSMRAERLLLHSTAPTPDATRRRSWARFERDLAAVLSTLDGEVLVLDVKGTAAYVQLRAKARRFRCEAVSNAFLPPQEQLDDGRISALLALGWRPPAPTSSTSGGSPNFSHAFAAPARPDDVARLLVRTLREVYDVPSPEHLEYTSFDDDGHRSLLPSLGIARRSPPHAEAGRRRKAHASRAARVRRSVLGELRRGTGDESLAFDANGVVGVHVGDIDVDVRVLTAPLVVRLSCVLAEGVEPRPALPLVLHELNLSLILARLVYHRSTVLLAVDLPAAPFRVDHLGVALEALRSTAARVRAQILGSPPEVSA